MRVRSNIGILIAWALVAVVVVACSSPASSPTGTAAVAPATASPALATAFATSPATPTGTAAPFETPAPTAVPTPVPTPVPTSTPEPAPISITNVECLTGQTVRFHVHIESEQGVTLYRLWSTWGGGGDTDVPFASSLPHEIDGDVEFTHALVDPVAGRTHEFGLAVTVEGATDPIIVYAWEPENRCPGH